VEGEGSVEVVILEDVKDISKDRDHSKSHLKGV